MVINFILNSLFEKLNVANLYLYTSSKKAKKYFLFLNTIK